MPEAEPDAYAIRFYFRIGLALLIPVAVIFFLMSRAAVDTSALESAKPCSVNTQDPASACLSRFAGVVTAQDPQYRAPAKLTISVAESTVHVGWTCVGLSNDACASTTFKPGTNVVTEWWRGRVVTLGMAEGQPSVITDASPAYDQVTRGPFPIVALMALTPLVLAGLLRQAPMSVSKLIETSFATSSLESREAVPRSIIFRVAIGGWGGYSMFIWLAFYLAFIFSSAGDALYTLYAPLAWLSSGLVGYAVTGSAAYLYLAHLVRTSNRETVTVQRIKLRVGRNHNGMQVWYGLRDGKLASRYIGPQGLALSREGDRIDALTDPRTGKIRRVLGDALA